MKQQKINLFIKKKTKIKINQVNCKLRNKNL